MLYIYKDLGTEMVSEPINDPIIPINDLTLPKKNTLNNNDDYISDEEFDANLVPIRYFNNGIELDDSDWHYPYP